MAFVDTSVFVAAFNKQDTNHQTGKELLSKAFEKFEWLYTSDYILDETISLAWSRTKNSKLVLKLDTIIEDSEKVKMLHVDETMLGTAKIFMHKYCNLIPTLTDWTSLALMKKNRIPLILSFDEHFTKVTGIKEFSEIRQISNSSELF